MSLILERVSPLELKPSNHNARTHSRKQIRQIGESIQTFGFTNPILIDEGNVLIAGHGRLEAAKNLGLDEVQAIRLFHLSEAQKRALMLADNKIALNAGWDLEILAAELTSLSEMQLDFSLEVTGFEVPEIDLLIGEHAVDDGRTRKQPRSPISTCRRSAGSGRFGILGSTGCSAAMQRMRRAMQR